MPETTRSGRFASGMASGGTFIACAWHRGCSSAFYGSAFTNTRGVRQEARREGWLVGQEGNRFANSLGHVIRVDYCPEHAPRERERRGLRPVPQPGDPSPSGPASQLERGINAPSRDHNEQEQR